MGEIYAEIQLANPSRGELTPVVTRALVDTGPLFLCIPEHIAVQLNLTQYEIRGVTLAHGSCRKVPYVGPVRINYLNRMGLTGALVMGDTALSGAIPIEAMDLVIHPAQLKLTVNPNLPRTHVTAHYK